MKPVVGRFVRLALLGLGLWYFLQPFLIAKANTQPTTVAAMRQTSDDARELRSGGRLEREMSAGQTHTYKLALQAGQYLKLVVEQRSINVALTLFAPDGKKLTEVNGQKFRQGIERLYWVTDSSGSFRLDISAVEKEAPTGSYEVRVDAIREAGEKDRLQITAVQLYSEASQLEGGKEADAKTKAIAKYGEALKLYREAGDRRGEGASLHRIGRVYWDKEEFQKALDYFNQALPLYHEAGDQQGEASVLSDTGGVYSNVYWDGFDRQKSLNAFDQGLPLAQASGNKEVELRILYNKALLYDRTGDWQKAIEFYKESLPPRRASGDRKTEGAALNITLCLALQPVSGSQRIVVGGAVRVSDVNDPYYGYNFGLARFLTQ